jgi:hypothetical protein
MRKFQYLGAISSFGKMYEGFNEFSLAVAYHQLLFFWCKSKYLTDNRQENERKKKVERAHQEEK